MEGNDGRGTKSCGDSEPEMPGELGQANLRSFCWPPLAGDITDMSFFNELVDAFAKFLHFVWLVLLS